jgi:Domain of unknown function (DUF4410)
MCHSPCQAWLRILGLILSCIASSLLVTGCQSTGKSNLREPLVVKLGQFKSATVEVKSTVTKPPKRLDEFMAQLESRIIARLRSTNAFTRIYPAAAIDSPSELKILVTITKVRDVDNTDRLMWGAFAGQANSQATVELLEQPSGKLLGVGDIEGKSSGGSVMAGTTLEAVDRVADQVVRLVMENL